ncbi:DNA-binding PadR family transcriptional regulator [Marisediminicola sp. UYEF4]|uniref:PadR family transcriptional regulator n=1 Tax=Marisediminicola sp. UYEF4 TaxID=1756384 RepID=UPI003399F0A6
MSVRGGLLAILSLGPAYGLQLHAELTSRAPHRGPVNVGQIYATLDRLGKQGLITSSGVTSDGLPLYRLSSQGRSAVDASRETAAVHTLPEWTEMLDQIIIESSIQPTAAAGLARAYRAWWTDDLARVRSVLENEAPKSEVRLAFLARQAQALAALDWLGSVIDALRDDDASRPYSTDKPRRGRRPRTTVVGASLA